MFRVRTTFLKKKSTTTLFLAFFLKKMTKSCDRPTIVNRKWPRLGRGQRIEPERIAQIRLMLDAKYKPTMIARSTGVTKDTVEVRSEKPEQKQKSLLGKSRRDLDC